MKNSLSNRTESSKSLVLVPQEFLESIAEQQQRILEVLERSIPSSLTGDHIPEHEARQSLGKGSTWFWEQRKSGALPYTKVGGKVYYRRSDLAKLFNQSSSKS